MLADYSAKESAVVKALGFIQSGGPWVGRSVLNYELFAGKFLYEEPLGNTGLGPRSIRPSEPDLEGD